QNFARLDIGRDNDRILLILFFARKHSIPAKARPARLIEDEKMGRYRLREQFIWKIAGPRGCRNPVNDHRLCRQHWEAGNDFRFESIELERLCGVYLAELILPLLAH